MARSFVPMILASWVGAAVQQGAANAAAAVTGVAAAPIVPGQPSQESTSGLRLTRAVNTTVEERRLKPWEDTASIVVRCDTGLVTSCGEGTCDHLGVCICKDDWYTTDASQPCKTAKKSRTTAILLQVFLGYWGAGSFYCGWTAFGAGSLVLMVMTIICLCCTVCGAGCIVAGVQDPDAGAQDGNEAAGAYSMDQSETKGDVGKVAGLGMMMTTFGYLLSCCTLLAAMGMWIAVIVFIADNKSRDGDNVPLS